MYSKHLFIVLLVVGLVFSALGIVVVSAVSSLDDSAAGDSKIKFYRHANGLGAGGYDVVAYFSDSAARAGEERYNANFAGMEWRFTSFENRDAFVADPAKYLPAYGGHCAYGVAQGYLVFGDPEAWTVRDGVLYLNYNKNVRNAWLSNVEEFIRRSTNNWTRLNK